MNRPKILKSTIRLCELQRKIRNNRAEKGVGTMTPKEKAMEHIKRTGVTHYEEAIDIALEEQRKELFSKYKWDEWVLEEQARWETLIRDINNYFILTEEPTMENDILNIVKEARTK